jgi:hypothetical protein
VVDDDDRYGSFDDGDEKKGLFYAEPPERTIIAYLERLEVVRNWRTAVEPKRKRSRKENKIALNRRSLLADLDENSSIILWRWDAREQLERPSSHEALFLALLERQVVANWKGPKPDADTVRALALRGVFWIALSKEFRKYSRTDQVHFIQVAHELKGKNLIDIRRVKISNRIAPRRKGFLIIRFSAKSPDCYLSVVSSFL